MSEILSKIVSFFMTILMFFQSLLGLGGKPSDPSPQNNTVKNVIFMIGDGMGFNSIEKTRKEENISVFNMDAFPMKGESKTNSANSSVTDSAAGGSALACGLKINNGAVGVYPSDPNNENSHPLNLAELAVSQGKLAGVITTDSTAGATPASFSAHTSSRSNEYDITSQQMKSDLTLIWGTGASSFSSDIASSNGFSVITDKTEMDALKEGSKSFGQFAHSLWHNYEYKGMPTLAEMTEKAIDLIDDDEDGFFLMVEGAHIDKNNHNNDGEKMKDALMSFDNAVGVALEYARTHKDTMVIVTADHETGGITLTDGEYKYTTGSHTGVNVPLFVYGKDGFIENGAAIDNSEVSIRTAKAMGCENFPQEVFVSAKAAA